MLGPEGAFQAGEGLRVERDGLVQVARRPVRGGEVVARDERVGMRLAEDLHAPGKHVLKDRDCPVQLARSPVRLGEVVAGHQRLRVELAEDPLSVGAY